MKYLLRQAINFLWIMTNIAVKQNHIKQLFCHNPQTKDINLIKRNSIKINNFLVYLRVYCQLSLWKTMDKVAAFFVIFRVTPRRLLNYVRILFYFLRLCKVFLASLRLRQNVLSFLPVSAANYKNCNKIMSMHLLDTYYEPLTTVYGCWRNYRRTFVSGSRA